MDTIRYMEHRTGGDRIERSRTRGTVYISTAFWVAGCWLAVSVEERSWAERFCMGALSVDP
jgi:hypothetical protein